MASFLSKGPSEMIFMSKCSSLQVLPLENSGTFSGPILSPKIGLGPKSNWTNEKEENLELQSQKQAGNPQSEEAAKGTTSPIISEEHFRTFKNFVKYL